MLRGEWERIGKEVREGKKWQIKGSRKGVRGGGWKRWGGGVGRERAERRRCEESEREG